MSSQPHRTPFPGAFPLPVGAAGVLQALTAAGGRPYVVGGSVRDALRHPGHAPKDLDIEVYGLPTDDVVASLRQVGAVDEVGRSFAVIKVRRQGVDFDVSLPRADTPTGPGPDDTEVVPDPHATLPDATARRDFTVNALMYDPSTHEIVDCWGGLHDLEHGILKHTSDAFCDDPLRVLRAVGFVARFGFVLDERTAQLCRDLAETFTELAPERVWTEWHKIAAKGTHLSAALTALEETGWVRHFPTLARLRGLEQDAHWHPEGDVYTHAGLAGDAAARLADEAGLTGDDRAVVVLAALLHDAGKVTHTRSHLLDDGTAKITSYGHDVAGVLPARAFLRQIGAPRRLTGRIAPLIKEHMVTASTASPSAAAVRRLARRLAPATLAEWAIVVEADKGGRGAASRTGETEPWMAKAATLGVTHGPQRQILSGAHLIAAGMTPGPEFGDILRAASRAQDDGVFEDEAGALAWLAELSHG